MGTREKQARGGGCVCVTCCRAFSKGGCGKLSVGEMEGEGKQELAGAWPGRGHE